MKCIQFNACIANRKAVWHVRIELKISINQPFSISPRCTRYTLPRKKIADDRGSLLSPGLFSLSLWVVQFCQSNFLQLFFIDRFSPFSPQQWARLFRNPSLITNHTHCVSIICHGHCRTRLGSFWRSYYFIFLSRLLPCVHGGQISANLRRVR